MMAVGELVIVNNDTGSALTEDIIVTAFYNRGRINLRQKLLDCRCN